jgi:hypothetical protein
MAGSPDYEELLRIFNADKVEYLVVGGYAVMRYSEPRCTKDLDLWVRNSPANSERLFRALARRSPPKHARPRERGSALSHELENKFLHHDSIIRPRISQ